MTWRRVAVSMAATLFLAAGLVRLGAQAQGSAAQGGITSRDPQMLSLQGALLAELGSNARLATRRDGTFLRYAGTSRREPNAPPGGRTALTNQEVAASADAFLFEYGALFGIARTGVHMRSERVRMTDDGRGVVRYQQEYLGVPVFGGEMTVQVAPDGALLTALADISVSPAVDASPAIDARYAATSALRAVALREAVPPDALVASEPALWVYDPAVVDEAGEVRLVWRCEVRGAERPDVNTLVLIDAQTGKVALSFSQVSNQAPAPSPTRIVYDNANDASRGLPGIPPPARIEGSAPSAVADVNLAYDYAGATFAFFRGLGRDSLDGHGIPLTSTVRYCDPTHPCPLANAFWNGSQAVFGMGYATDDVVAHEFSHGVIDSEARFFYYRQSGALSEGFADAFGEFVDLQSSTFDGSDDVTHRWQIGEDLPVGALRDMRNPLLFRDPDRVTSGAWDCDATMVDNGGIHTNNGVMNKAVYLMTDGGTANGVTVQGLGIPIASRVLYEALTNLLTSGSDYADLAVALVQASANLGLSAPQIEQVHLATIATEMAVDRVAGCPATEAPFCDAGTVTVLLSETFEEPAVSATRWAVGAHWYYPQNTHPYRSMGQLWDMTNATSGRYNLWGDADFGNSGLIPALPLVQPLSGTVTMAQGVTIPQGAVAYVHFRHSYMFQHLNPRDAQFAHGGVAEYSIDGGRTWLDLGPQFTTNGYDGIISAGGALAGRMGFVGDSNGYISTRANLSSIAGRTLQLRFILGTDATNGSIGWFIDDITLYTCALPPTPTPRARVALPLMMNDYTVAEGSVPLTTASAVGRAVQVPTGSTLPR